MPLADGQLFAGYTILGVLGTGGMGEVYLAEHPRLPRRDALKVLGTTVSDDTEYRQRFNQEAEMVATLRHPNIVTIYDRGECDDRLWIAMEFVDGTDAYRLMTDDYRAGIPADQVVRIVEAVAEALDYAHSRDVLHRDIKPANILLGRPEGHGGTASSAAFDRIMLADFGVARWVGQPSDLTGTEVTVGTVTYAPPEQLTGQQVDGRADQYALAATAYHLMTGTAPFTDSNPAVVIGQHISSTPPAIGKYRPDLAAFGPVFAKALAKKPGERYPCCRDFAAAMRQALGSAGAAMGQPQRATGRRWLAAGAGALVLLGALGAVTLLAGHRSSPTDPASTGSSSPGSSPGPSPGPSSTPPPPAVAARMDLPIVVLGADCAVLGAAAVTETGAPAYCARTSSAGIDPAAVDPASIETVWSPQPERLRSGASQPNADPASEPPGQSPIPPDPTPASP